MKLEIQKQSPEDHQPCRTGFRSVDMGGLASLPMSGFFVFLFTGYLVTRTGRTGRPILTTSAPYGVFLGKDVPFGG